MSSPGPIIVTEGVSVIVNSALALASTSFTVKAGEVVAVVGPSGSGKSTLLSCLSGIRLPTSGSVNVAGHTLNSMSIGARAKFRRKKCGVIFQDSDLLEELDVVANVALPLIFSGVARPIAMKKANAILATVHCESLAARRPSQISGGEAQRVAVARAFVSGPAIVIADEPTASLDIDNAAVVTDMIVAHARATHAATVIATHDAAVADRCDRVLVLDRHASGQHELSDAVSAR